MNTTDGKSYLILAISNTVYESMNQRGKSKQNTYPRINKGISNT